MLSCATRTVLLENRKTASLTPIVIPAKRATASRENLK
jgi:hypothetical protein